MAHRRCPPLGGRLARRARPPKRITDPAPAAQVLGPRARSHLPRESGRLVVHRVEDVDP